MTEERILKDSTDEPYNNFSFNGLLESKKLTDEQIDKEFNKLKNIKTNFLR